MQHNSSDIAAASLSDAMLKTMPRKRRRTAQHKNLIINTVLTSRDVVLIEVEVQA
jgi:hypothetical protein